MRLFRRGRSRLPTVPRKEMEEKPNQAVLLESLEPRLLLDGGPLAQDDFFELQEDAPSTFLNVLANDSGDGLKVIGAESSSRGTVTFDDTGVYYQPAANFSGLETFTYTVQDALGQTAVAAAAVSVLAVNDTPVLKQTFAPLSVNINASPSSFSLEQYFADADIPLIYRFTSNMGTFDVLLYPFQTPITVNNFQRYADSGAYVNSFIHRSVAGFVVQGGGYTFTDENGEPEEIPAYDPIQNEPGISNLRGTIAMAKLGGDPNSATSQWFFNLADNSANLDQQNGGFTVFGEVLGDGMSVIDAIAALPTYDLGSPYDEIPMIGWDEQSPPTSQNLVMFQSILPVASETVLTYSIVANTNPALVTASLDANHQLILQYAPDAAGTAQITIRATDDQGAFVETVLEVSVNGPPAAADDDFVVAMNSTDNVLNVLANDTNLPEGESMTLVAVSEAQHGTVEILDGGTALRYTPAADFFGTDEFTYTVRDAAGLEATATVSVLVNAAPIAREDSAEMDYGQENVVIDATANDVDPDKDSFTVGEFTQGTQGTVVLATDPQTGRQTFTYTPGAAFDGEDTFTYTIVDPHGAASAAATVTVRMKPDAANDEFTVAEDSGATVLDVLAGDRNRNPAGTLTLTGISGLQNRSGTLTLVTPGEGETFAPYLTYQPFGNFHGTDTFTYTVQNEVGLTDTATVVLTVSNVNDAPRLTQSFAQVNVNRNVVPTVLNLASYFWDSDSRLIYRFTSNMGTFDVLLYPFQTPITVNNFQRYADSGAYVNSFIHRSVAGFVVQGGGYTFTDENGEPEEIPAYDPIQNEPGISNLRGTIAMAKLGGDPNSATSQWFFNLADNSANLDQQNGGFTVFGEVLGDGMSVIDAIAALPTYNLGSSYSEIPLIGYSGQGSPQTANLVRFSSIQALPCEIPLTYSIVANTNPALVTASLDANHQLILQYAPDAAGTAQITIRVTDEQGAFVETVIDVLVNDRPDLTVHFGSVSLPDRPAVGDAGRAQVFVLNQEPFVAAGRIDLQLWLSRDGDVTNGNGDDYLVTTLANQPINLRRGQSAAFVLNFALPANLVSGEYRVVAVVDSGKAISERYETNNAAVYGAQTYGVYSAHADLTGDILRTVSKNAVMTAGDVGTATVQIANVGNLRAVGQVTLALYASSDRSWNDADTLLATQTVSLSLAPGQSRTYAVPFTIPASLTSGGYHLIARIDSTNTLPEGAADLLAVGGINAEANNNAVASNAVNGYIYVQRPDLRCAVYRTSLPAAPLGGEAAWALVRISNYSYVRAVGLVNVQLYLRPKNKPDGSEDILLTARDHFRLKLAGGYSILTTLKFRLPPNLEEGAYQLVARIAPASAGLSDDNNNNNTATYGTYQVREAFRDLTVSMTRRVIPNNPATKGDPVTVYVAITNKGNSPVVARGANAVRLNLWLCADNKLHDGTGLEYLLGTKLLKLALSPDEQMITAFSARLPGLDVLPAGNYYLIAEVDADNKVWEKTDDATYNGEANNTQAIKDALIVGLPDLTGAFASISLPTTGVVSGATGRAVVNVTNSGTVRATGVYNISLYASRDGTKDGQDVLIGSQNNIRLALYPGRTTSAAVPLALPLDLQGEYRILAVVDSADTIVEGSETNNVAVSAAEYNVQRAHVDLGGEILPPVVANPAIGGAPIQVPLQIRNNGNVAVRQPVRVAFFAVVGGVRQSLGTPAEYSVSLAAGQARTFVYHGVLPNVASPEAYHVEAEIDVAGAVNEWRPDLNAEENNRIVSSQIFVVNPAFVVLNGALQAPVVAKPAAADDTLRAAVRIVNAGNVVFQGQVNVAFVALRQGQPAVPIGQKQNVAVNLAPGKAMTISHDMALPANLAAGTYDVAAVLAETPDAAEVTVHVDNTAGLGALVIGSSNLVPSVAGTPLTGTVAKTSAHAAQVRVVNAGAVRSQGSADVQLWATADGVLDGTGDFLLATRANQSFSLPAGGSADCTLNFTLPAGMDNAATYRLAAVLLPRQGLGGDDSSDNTALAAGTFRVEDPWVDLTVAAVWNRGVYGGDNDPNTPDNVFLRGQPYSMTVSVTNHGNVAVGEFRTRLQALRVYQGGQWVDLASPLVLGEVVLPSLGSGETYTGTLPFAFPLTLPPQQSYQVNVLTDATNQIAEINGEANNLAQPNHEWYYAV